MYFKAELYLATESMEFDSKEQAYIGYDPDTYQEQGLIEKITAPTLIELKKKIENRLSFIKNMELVEEDDNTAHFEYQCEGEHDYRTPKEERIPFQELWSLYVSEVEETCLGAKLLKEII